MGRTIKRRIAVMTVLFLGTFTAVMILIGVKGFPYPYGEQKSTKEQIIALNEIEKLTEQEGVSPAKKQIEALQH